MERGGGNCISQPLIIRSQPTYKEWKGNLLVKSSTAVLGSQPTYKEWKDTLSQREAVALVGFPAYLQGMESTSVVSRFSGRYRVPSLPTRNGKYLTGLRRG